ncbi:MAG: T9SS type A sorting domain-containing protein, partial [Ferruginibacter sp.]|nr:T9SS type A sorting domain-containing protein [Ferruginibacter sp.]
QSPVTPQLLNTLTFKEGVGKNDTTLRPAFPFLQTPWRGFRGANFVGPKSDNIGLGIIPGYLGLSAYPNPFKTSTRIRYNLTDAANNVRVEIIDALGRRIAVYEQGKKPAGEYSFVFDKPNLAAASYYVRVYVDNFKSPTIGIVKTN